MKILHLLSSMELGGGPQHVLTLATGLRALGIESVVGGPEGPVWEVFNAAGFARLNPPDYASHHIDLVHTHGKWAGLIGRLAARRHAVPAVHTFHGLHYERYGPLKRRLYFALERWLARRSAAVIHLTDAQRAEAVHVGLPDGVVIPNGIDAAGLVAGALPREAARVALGLPTHAYVMGTIARLDPVKGIHRLLEALERLPQDTHLAVIGDGGERAFLEAKAAALDVRDRVHWLGARAQAWLYLRAFDVFVSASAREGHPLAVMEAMALGLPLVLSGIPAHRVLVSGGQLAPATPTGRAFAESVAWLRALPHIAADFGARNRRTIVAFDAARMVEQTAAVYLRATGRWSAGEEGRGFFGVKWHWTDRIPPLQPLIDQSLIDKAVAKARAATPRIRTVTINGVDYYEIRP